MEFYWWLIAALIMFVLEIIIPGFVIMWFGVGASVAAILSLLGVESLAIQVIVFSVVSIALVILSRTIFKNIFIRNSPGTGTVNGAKALIGKTGQVTETIDNFKSAGRITIESQDWMARSADGTNIDAEEFVTVLSIDGIKLIVKRVQ